MADVPDDEIYDDEAFIGVEEGLITDGKVLDDLDAEDEEDFVDDDDDDDADQADGDGAAEPAAPAPSGTTGGSGAPAAEDASEPMDEDDEQQYLPDMSNHRLTRHTDAVVSVAWSRTQANLVASGSCDDRAFLWRLDKDVSEAVELAGHTDTVACLAIDPTGEVVATGGMDGCTRIWSTASGEAKGVLDGPGEAVEWLAWHPKGTVLSVGSQDMTSWMYNAQQGQCMQVFTGQSGPVMAGGFTSDGKLLVTAGGEGDGAVRVWNPKTGACMHVMAPGHGAQTDAGITCLAFAEDPAVVAAGGVNGAVVLYNVMAGKPVAKMEMHTDSIEAIAFVRGLQLLGSCGLDGKAVVWDLTTHVPRCTCEHPDGVTCMAVQPGGPLFATGCLDGAVRVFDSRDGRVVDELGGGSAVQTVAWAADGRRLASGSDDGVVRVYDRA
eukprot:jgi/Ulvmu1/3034/UM015_0074.1